MSFIYNRDNLWDYFFFFFDYTCVQININIEMTIRILNFMGKKYAGEFDWLIYYALWLLFKPHETKWIKARVVK